MRPAFIKTLYRMARRDSRITFLVGDVGYGLVEGFAERLPRQFLNVGAAEQNMIGVAAGMAKEGRVVFAYSIGSFSVLRCLEQIRNDVCFHELPVTVVAAGAGVGFGAQGPSHHLVEDFAALRALPGITMVAPGDVSEVQGAVSALVKKGGPGYLRLDRFPSERIGGDPFQLGKCRLLRKGKAFTLLATGSLLPVALEVAERFGDNGDQIRVLSCHTVKPLDEEAILEASMETGGILTLEEHRLEGGLGEAVAALLADRGEWPRRFHRIAIRGEAPSPSASREFLWRHHGLDAEGVSAVLSDLL